MATGLDLLVDPFGLDLGLWERNSDGPYATDIEGPNGRHVVPLLNFVSWLGSTASVTIAYEGPNPDGDAAAAAGYARSGVTGSPQACRSAAIATLLLTSGCVGVKEGQTNVPSLLGALSSSAMCSTEGLACFLTSLLLNSPTRSIASNYGRKTSPLIAL